jgi:hypothetical protein
VNLHQQTAAAKMQRPEDPLLIPRDDRLEAYPTLLFVNYDQSESDFCILFSVF